MRGIIDNHLKSIMDFPYHGEVGIYQEDMDDFLKIAVELKLKGQNL